MTISEYKTQKSLKDYFRKLINKIDVCESIKTSHPEYYSDFCELFERHPDYPEKCIGMVDIIIQKNPEYENLEVCIKKENGDIDDISAMNKCITGKPGDKLKIAMRECIQPQIDEFKKKQRIYKCELCGVKERIEIDHHSEKTPFAKLYHDYMKINGLPLPTSFDNTEGHMKCFKEDDRDFRNSWFEYHKENVILRMLCKSCNNSQPKYKPNNRFN